MPIIPPIFFREYFKNHNIGPRWIETSWLVFSIPVFFVETTVFTLFANAKKQQFFVVIIGDLICDSDTLNMTI
jgi:hypothetical protein